MTDAMVVELARQTVQTMLLLMGPPLLIALLVGVAIAVLQAATQVQEMTLSFVPKILAVFLSLLVFGPWLISTMLTFSERLLSDFNSFIR
jgi:flagellar biosynthetic protein FliQ